MRIGCCSNRVVCYYTLQWERPISNSLVLNCACACVCLCVFVCVYVCAYMRAYVRACVHPCCVCAYMYDMFCLI